MITFVQTCDICNFEAGKAKREATLKEMLGDIPIFQNQKDGLGSYILMNKGRLPNSCLTGSNFTSNSFFTYFSYLIGCITYYSIFNCADTSAGWFMLIYSARKWLTMFSALPNFFIILRWCVWHCMLLRLMPNSLAIFR